MNSRAPAILDHLAALADTTRSRMLLLLDRHELTVSELCGVLQLPQSTVSRHLKALADAAGSARAPRARATCTRCRATSSTRRRAGSGCWSASRSARRRPRRRTSGGFRRRWRRTAHASRRSSSPRRPGNGIGCATSCSAIAFTSPRWPRFADRTWIVGDLGCGTGQVSAALAPFVARVVAVDASARDAAGGEEAAPAVRQRRSAARRARGAADRRRAARCGDADAGAAPRRRAATRAGRGGARAASPGGRVVVVDMLPHDRERYRQQMGHVWLGFSDEQMRRCCWTAGFRGRSRIVSLPPDAKAKGPGLFVATGTKPRKHENTKPD